MDILLHPVPSCDTLNPYALSRFVQLPLADVGVNEIGVRPTGQATSEYSDKVVYVPYVRVCAHTGETKTRSVWRNCWAMKAGTRMRKVCELINESLEVLLGFV